MKNEQIELFKLAIGQSNWEIILNISIHIILVIIVLLLILVVLRNIKFRSLKVTKVDISLGKIGKIELRPSLEDKQIAHQIWTQLVTRKAAIPIDPKEDVIVEVYDSWYELFTTVRGLLLEIPAHTLKNKNTQKLIEIATKTLNDGLRPHLTKWQAKFRNWYNTNSDKLKDLTPQEFQEQYKLYDDLIAELHIVNENMIQYAFELKKIIDN